MVFRLTSSKCALLSFCVLLIGCSNTPQTANTQTSSKLNEVQHCTVTRVVDEDSLEVLCKAANRSNQIKLRLREIDAPELRQRFGHAARTRLQILCLNETIELPAHPEQDRYGRALTDVQCKQQDVGEIMVRSGLAWYYRVTSAEYPRLVQLKAQVQRQKLGLWGQATPTPPWAWRHGNPC